MIRIIAMLLVLAALTGCTHPRPQDQGIAVDVYPVTYQLSLAFDPHHPAQANAAWQRFQNRHPREILSNPVTFYYAGERTHKIVRLWRRQLLKQGAQEKKLHLQASSELKQFDVQVNLTTYQVATPLCHSLTVGKYQQGASGCFADSALWQSMTHPEDALRRQGR
jgi:hypothetical protein